MFHRRHRGRSTDPDDIVPLDADEQAKVVEGLGAEADRQTTLFKRIFVAILVVCGVGLVRCSLQLWLYEDTHPLAHQIAVEAVPSWAYQLTYAANMLGLYMCYRITQDGERLHTLLALGISWSTAVVWFALFQLYGVTNPISYWLPLGPVVWVHVAIDLKRSAARLDAELERLNAARYKYKDL